MSLGRSIKKDFNTMTLVLIPVAIAINVVIGEIVALLKLPVYLDSIGTVLVGAICGPWAGALTGTLSNIIWGLLIDPNAFPWFPVALVIGFVAGWCARFGLFKNWWKVIISGVLISLGSALASTPIAVWLYGGITASGSSFITAFLLQTGHDLITSVLSTNFIVEPVDKVATALLAFAIIQGLSARYVARFPRSENVIVEKQAAQSTQLIIAIAIAAVLIIIAATVLVSLVS
ncbi:MAG TPA: ECF transporter S component [Longilinea sp.]|nr:ECF transporter S component [Longilinea sp.]